MNLQNQKKKKAPGKLHSFYEGWRSEVLAEYILSEIAFVVPVHVRSDVGADFFCTLFSKEEKYLKPGKTFSVQAKAIGNEITLNSTNLNFLASLGIPHYLCVANRENSTIEMYSCQQLLPLFIKYGNFAKENSTGKKFLIKLKPIERYSTKNLDNLTKLINGKKKVKYFLELLEDNNISTWNKKKKQNRLR